MGTLEELCDYLEESLERAESSDWCVLTLLAEADTYALLADLIDEGHSTVFTKT